MKFKLNKIILFSMITFFIVSNFSYGVEEPTKKLIIDGKSIPLSKKIMTIGEEYYIPIVETIILLGGDGRVEVNPNDDTLFRAMTKINMKDFYMENFVENNSDTSYIKRMMTGDSEKFFLNKNPIYDEEDLKITIEDFAKIIDGKVSIDDGTIKINSKDERFFHNSIDTYQEGNDNELIIFRTKSSDKFEDNRNGTVVSGIMALPADEWIDWASGVKYDGFKNIRVTTNYSDGVNIKNAPFKENDISEEYLKVYEKLKEDNIYARFSLNFWDMDYVSKGHSLGKYRLMSKSELDRYEEYVRYVVNFLKGNVASYELWNEPDDNFNFNQYIRPEDYVKMARRIIPVIRSIDPDVKIIVGSTSDYRYKECRDYTEKIIKSGILSLADGFSIHPVNNDASPEFFSDYYYGYEEMWKNIKDLTKKNGFTGEYFADELNYRSFYSLEVLQPEPNDYHPYEEEVAAKYIGRMLTINLGMDVSQTMSGTNSTARISEGKIIKNINNIFAGLKPYEINLKIDNKNDKNNEILSRYYGFQDSMGNIYVGIWNDKKATSQTEFSDIDIEIGDLEISNIKVIDPLNGLEQNIVFENGETNSIKDFRLLDYPLFLKIY